MFIFNNLQLDASNPTRYFLTSPCTHGADNERVIMESTTELLSAAFEVRCPGCDRTYSDKELVECAVCGKHSCFRCGHGLCNCEEEKPAIRVPASLPVQRRRLPFHLTGKTHGLTLVVPIVPALSSQTV